MILISGFKDIFCNYISVKLTQANNSITKWHFSLKIKCLVCLRKRHANKQLNQYQHASFRQWRTWPSEELILKWQWQILSPYMKIGLTSPYLLLARSLTSLDLTLRISWQLSYRFLQKGVFMFPLFGSSLTHIFIREVNFVDSQWDLSTLDYNSTAR